MSTLVIAAGKFTSFDKLLSILPPVISIITGPRYLMFRLICLGYIVAVTSLIVSFKLYSSGVVDSEETMLEGEDK